MDREIILEISGLSKEFAVKGRMFPYKKEMLKAVQNVTLTLEKGETLGIVGESGCGKSTLGRLIMRLIEPTCGSVVLEGENLMDLSSPRNFGDTEKTFR